jgi:3-hydroxyisobutyrate dehydrogenase
MAAAAVAGGWEVYGYDPDPARVEMDGVRPVGTIGELGRETGLVFCVVQTFAQVELVAAQLDSGATLVVVSTVGPSNLQRLGAECAERGIDVLDAPVTGQAPRIETLVFMVSGPPAVRERARPCMETIGKQVFVMGDNLGLGQAMKVVNNLILYVNKRAVAEGEALAAAWGISQEMVKAVVSNGTGDSYVIREPIDVETDDHNQIVIEKDLQAAIAAGEERDVELPAGLLVLDWIQALRATT